MQVKAAAKKEPSAPGEKKSRTKKEPVVDENGNVVKATRTRKPQEPKGDKTEKKTPAKKAAAKAPGDKAPAPKKAAPRKKAQDSDGDSDSSDVNAFLVSDSDITEYPVSESGSAAEFSKEDDI